MNRVVICQPSLPVSVAVTEPVAEQRCIIHHTLHTVPKTDSSGQLHILVKILLGGQAGSTDSLFLGAGCLFTRACPPTSVFLCFNPSFYLHTQLQAVAIASHPLQIRFPISISSHYIFFFETPFGNRDRYLALQPKVCALEVTLHQAHTHSHSCRLLRNLSVSEAPTKQKQSFWHFHLHVSRRRSP